MAKDRILWIDNAKAIAILLVVVGHIIQFLYSPGGFDQNIVFRYIYAFHMPLFFMLSGLVTKPLVIADNNTINSENSRFGGGNSIVINKLKSRFYQLVVPFCIWGVICINTTNHEPYYKIFIRPDLSLWFLWVLFIINVAFYCGQLAAIALRIRSNILCLIATYIALLIISHYGRGLFGLGLAYTHFLYFSIGVVIGQYRTQLAESKRLTAIGILSLFAFGLMASVWYRIPSKVPTEFPHWISTLNEYSIYHIVTAFTGSIGFILLSARFMNSISCRCLIYLGINTLGIYAIHQSIIWLINQLVPSSVIAFSQTTSGFICSFAAVLIITIIVLEVLKTNRYTSSLFLGAK